MAEEHRPIIIRRKKIVKKHHGGSWKIALADFMTALMALFLVMWILSMSSEKDRQGISEYFRTPLLVSMAGGERSSNAANVIQGGGADPTHMDGEQARIDLRRESRPADVRRHFNEIRRRVEAAIDADPVLKALKAQLRFDVTREGLRIMMLDTETKPMFEIGSDRIAPYMERLLRTLAPLLNEIPNEVTISGHTDSLPYAGGERGYSNWELSADRANESRKALMAGGFDPERLLLVMGAADRIPLDGTEPDDPRNRRITIVVHTLESSEFIKRQGFFPQDEQELEASLEPDVGLLTEQFQEATRATDLTKQK
ncbi:flagellar motor protein MotB [Pseudidiomarina donghaiensis]|uniref:Motility protein MotB n=1 Tax=Pseudidiomarina donghaiensis TaxID=519452 RepID=A0A432XGU1_9GAMM|nr:flagellar motor protein MotB [Pseudidiomarina donghaiensis]RUO47941.1 motility protein MotB [Pseudidiomarina donghaiensis]SFV22666.1 chemotaxis protein MotB [Pseudidiomarina donghaiensis]